MATTPSPTGSTTVAPLGEARGTLALFFVPGLYLVFALAMVLMLLVGAVIIYGIAKLAELFHRIPVGIIGLVALGVLCGIWFLLKGALASVRRASFPIHGMPIDRNQAAPLFELLHQLCRQMGSDPPSNVVIELGPNFFVTEAIVHTFTGPVRGRTLCVSAPLLRLLTPDEFEAILAHELAHFTGSDTAFSRWFYPVYRGTSVAIEGLQSVSAGDTDSTAWIASPLILPYLLLSTYLDTFARLERRIGRARELRADGLATERTSPDTVASALTKVHAFAPAWREIERLALEAVKERKPLLNVSRMFAEWIATHLSELVGHVLTASHSELAHPTDTHPPLRARLRNLGLSPATAVILSPGASADAMVPSLEELEEHLSEEFAALNARLYFAGRAANPSERSQSVSAMYAGRACYQCGREFFAGEAAYEHLGLKVCKQCARNLKIA